MGPFTKTFQLFVASHTEYKVSYCCNNFWPTYNYYLVIHVLTAKVNIAHFLAKLLIWLILTYTTPTYSNELLNKPLQVQDNITAAKRGMGWSETVGIYDDFHILALRRTKMVLLRTPTQNSSVCTDQIFNYFGTCKLVGNNSRAASNNFLSKLHLIFIFTPIQVTDEFQSQFFNRHFNFSKRKTAKTMINLFATSQKKFSFVI